MNKQIQLKASKTNESCLLFNKSEDYSILGFISIAGFIIYFVYLVSLNVFLTVLQQLFVVLFSFILCINVSRTKLINS